MSLSVKQIGQVSAQLKSQIEQFQQALDQNDNFIGELNVHVSDANHQLHSLSTSVSTRESDSQKTKDSLEYADITVSGLQKATSVLDNDAMQTSRLWEAAYSQPSTGSDQRALIETGTMESVYSELLKIEEFYQHELKEGRRPSEVNEKIRLALVQKIAELKATGSLK